MIDLLIAPAVSKETAGRQATHARGLGLSPPRPRRGALAVVGGGQSVQAYIETLRRWEGDVWAVNGAYDWCIGNGIDCTFYTADPQLVTVEYARNADRAILPPWCHPDIWDKPNSVELVEFFPMFSSSAPNVAFCAFELGYTSITYFGCDCSFSDASHIYEDRPTTAHMIVQIDGMNYLTTPAYFAQAMELSTICREFPMINEMSAGLTRALTKNPDYDIVGMANDVRGMFDIDLSHLEILA